MKLPAIVNSPIRQAFGVGEMPQIVRIYETETVRQSQKLASQVAPIGAR